MNDAIDLPVSERFVETVSITDVGVYQRGTAGIEESGDVAATKKTLKSIIRDVKSEFQKDDVMTHVEAFLEELERI